MSKEAQKAADDFLDSLFEATFGKEGKERAAVVLHRINRDLNPAYPRHIPVINLSKDTYEDGIAPGAYGVTNRQKWSRYFKEVHVEMPQEDKPKPKAKAKSKEVAA